MKSLEMSESFNTIIKKRLVILKQKKKNILIFVLVGFLLALVISFLQPKLFKATSRITFKYDSINNSTLNKTGSLANEINNIISDKNIAFIKNHLEIDRDIKENIETIEDIASSSLIVKAISNTSQQSADIANGLVELFVGNAIINNRGAHLTLLSDLTKRDKENADGILRNAKNYREFISTANIKVLNPNDLIIVDQIADLESDLEIIEYDNKLYQHILSKLISFLEKKFPDIDSKSALISNNKIDSLRISFERTLTEKIIQRSTQNIKNVKVAFPWKNNYNSTNTDSLSSLLKNYTSDYIKKNLKKDSFELYLLNKLTCKIEETQIKLNAIDLSKSILYDIITGLEEKFSLIPIRYIEVAQLERTKKFNLKLDKKIKRKKIEIINKSGKYFADVDSVSKAEPPTSYYSPNIFSNLLLGTFGGFFLGMILTLSSTKKRFEYISSMEDFENVPFQVISQVPTFPHGQPVLLKPHDSRINEKSKQIISTFESIEAFLKYGNLDKALSSVLITSPNNGEGKSLVASNIAITLAKSNAKVLLVDANLVSPKLNKLFGLHSSPSLAHYLLKKKELEDIIRTTQIPNLSIITGVELVQNAGTIMNSDKMKEFIKIVNSKFDFVIYDSASLSSLSENTTIAKLVKQTILIVRANKTLFSTINEAVSTLRKNGINNFGVILNDTEV